VGKQGKQPPKKSLAMLLRGAYLTMHRRAQAIYATVGATADQAVALALLASEDGLTQNELVDRTYSDPSTVAALLRLIESQGYIRRVRDERDGRAKRVYLTAAGRRRHRQLAHLRRKRRAPLEESLAPGQLETLMDALERILNFKVPEETGNRRRSSRKGGVKS